jgi:hypothetical protein
MLNERFFQPCVYISDTTKYWEQNKDHSFISLRVASDVKVYFLTPRESEAQPTGTNLHERFLHSATVKRKYESVRLEGRSVRLSA